MYYIVEVAALNAYVLDKHAHTGRDSRDYLTFRIALAEELVGSFSGRRRIGRPRSLENQRLERLDTSLGHWPEVVQEKRDCVVYKCTGEAGIDEVSVQAWISSNT